MAKRLRQQSLTSVHETGHEESFMTAFSLDEIPGHTPKYANLGDADQVTSMHCLLPPHATLKFATYAAYETHYQQAHTNRCVDCHGNFPSSHYLDLHIAENHDPILAAKGEAGEKTLRCFVEGCDKICLEWKKRRSHLIDKHGFPKNYDFFIVDTGIDGRRSMLRPGVDAEGHRKSSRERLPSDGSSRSNDLLSRPSLPNVNYERLPKTIPDQSEFKANDQSSERGLHDLTESMSSLKMVPRSITFGKKTGITGFARK